MAYASVASLSHTIDILLSYHQHSISPQVKDQIISLRNHVDFLQSFLEGFPKRANNWEEIIREVTVRAEDIIELILSDSLLESTVGPSQSKHEIHHDFNELQRVAEEIESIAGRVKGGSTETETLGGNDPELMKVIYRLGEGPPALTKIAIVGMAGTGKTTLARNAYSHPLILENFSFRGWSTVTSDYSLRGIILDLLLSMNIKFERPFSSNSDGDLVDRLYRLLYGRRYLIVLDDVWSREAWKGLKSSLPDNGNGSRIILTTRFPDVARNVNYIHEMRLLDEDQSWKLIREKIFKGDPCPFQLEATGKTIARSCRGHRLSIEVVSVILDDDQTEVAWEGVLENIKKLTSEDEFEFLRLLSISYWYLPHHLRPCFLYLGFFPEKEGVYVSKLVKLWAAEGFLNQSGSRSFEERGEECVEALVRRGLVLVSKRKSDGRIKSITVHDLIRELIQGQAREDNFFRRFNRFGRLKREAEASLLQACRRVSNLPFDEDIFKGVYGSTIRTMLYGDKEPVGSRCSVGNVRLLRILDFSNDHGDRFTKDVCELFHLRYLAFDFSFSFSKDISNLQNLQTLIIGNRISENLPEGIWRLPNLRHLLMFRLDLPGQKVAPSALENLQTLSSVKDFVCSRETLQMIPNLQKLSIFYSERFKDVVEDYELHNLKYLQKLEILKIEMDCSSGEHHRMSCAFPPTVKKLNLFGVRMSWEDMKIVGSLPNLQILKLRNYACFGETWETSEGGFSQLIFLQIRKSNLENWITEGCHFPRLKTLVLHHCLHLSLAAKKIQEDRLRLGDDSLQIYVV